MARHFSLVPPLFLALLLLRGVIAAGSSEEDYFEKCCELGQSWAGQNLRCEKFTGPVTGVPEDEQPVCLETIDICCRKAFQEQSCNQGKADARAGRSCAQTDTNDSRKELAAGMAEYRRDCCEGCKLGILTGLSGKSCVSKKFSLGIPWDPVFMECCNEAITSSTQDGSSTSTKITLPLTSSTVETTPESEEFDEDIDETTDPVTFKSDDLCQILKGLLCSEICVPTPGSYYCKCHDGSTLQEDGRTCKSNVTTEVPTTTPISPMSSTTISSSPESTTFSTPPLSSASISNASTSIISSTSFTSSSSLPLTTPLKTTLSSESPKSTSSNSPTSASNVSSSSGLLTTAFSSSAHNLMTLITGKKYTLSIPSSSAFKLLTTGAKSRTTRSSSTEDNELNFPCPAGYRFSAESETCDDIDECREEPTAICLLGASCLNTNGSYQCLESNRSQEHCAHGYRWNATQGRCLDVDECLEDTHKCLVESENCRNLEGSYECEVKCESGFIFNGNYGACLDINECTELTNACPQSDKICINTLGSFECKSLREYQQLNSDNSSEARGPNEYENVDDGGSDAICAVGFMYNARLKRCDDIDECHVHHQPCLPGEICRNTIGGYDCIPAGCPRGFVLANDVCQDVDECEQGLHSCAPHERCQNTNGSFTCEPPRPTHRPVSVESPGIVCRKGYKPDDKTRGCVDINECVEGPGCRDHERCRNLQGSYDCSPLCGPGWYFELQTKTCQDVNECLLGHHNCRQRTHYCRNTNGSFVCEPLTACTAGYRRSENGSCVDIDECLESLHTCSRESHRYCVNRDGGYECITRLPSCSRGFEYSLLTRQCEDVDECRSGRANCEARLNERCVNLPGSYRCERPIPDLPHKKRPACPAGFSYDVALRRCSDIDECADGTHNCGEQKCYNLPGTFQCAKAPVPVLRKNTTTTPKAGIGTTARGTCANGFRYDNARGGCVDVNECRDLEDACSSVEDCENTPGSFRCSCRIGFRRDPFTQTCIDLNECQLENHCLSSQRCDNTIGSYTCVRFLPCGTGYTLNAATEICEDDDECALGTHDCAPGYRCRNTLGSYRCDRDRATIATLKPTPRRTLKPTFAPPRTTSTSITTTTKTTTTTTTTPRPTTTSTPRTTTTRRTTTTSTTPRPTTTSTPRTTTTRRTTTTSTPKPTTKLGLTTSTTIGTTVTTEDIPTVGSLITTTKTPKTTVVVRPRINCPRGFESGPIGQCIDIDECHRNLKMCGVLRCVNTLGSYRCEPRLLCAIGFAPDPVTGECKDVDECSEGTHKCGPQQTCDNRQGGYICKCPPGYEVSKNHDCLDIDECTRLAGALPCGSGGRCLNTPGSYRCQCKTGFESGPGSVGCRDVDECARTPSICQQECYNTWGGHRCGCRFGYRLKPDNRTCEDIDECAEFKENNLCVGICDNTPGSYACRCPDGYRLSDDGRTCQDIDECANENICRSQDEICQNVRGGFRCNRISCPVGYIRDIGRKNRCVRESMLCPVDDQACFLRPAHYTFNYIAIVSMYPIPVSTGQLELFTMRGANIQQGSTVRFSLAFIAARAPPHVISATESCFAVRRPLATQAVLVLTRSLPGPQDIELEFTMEIYGPSGAFSGTAVAKIFIVVTQYEF